MIEIAVTAITAITNAILGLVTYYKNPNSATNKLLAFLALQIGIWSITNYLSLHAAGVAATLFWIRIDMIPGTPMAPTIYLLVRAFPNHKLDISKLKLAAITALVLITAVLALTPYMFTQVVIEGKNIQAIPGPAIAVFALNFIGFLLLALVTLIQKYRKSVGVERSQLKFLLTGLGITFSLIAVTQLLFVILFKTSFFIQFGPLYTLILVGSISYAIIKHRFLDIRLLVARTVTYALTIGVVALVISGLVVVVVQPALGVKFDSLQTLVFIFLLAVTAISFQRLKNFVGELTDRFLFKGNYDSNQVLNNLSHVMASTLLLDDICHGILTIILSELHITQGVFVLLGEARIAAVKSEGYSKPPEFDESQITLLSNTRDTLIFDEIEPGPLKDVMREMQLSVVIHLRTEGQQIGIMCLGAKASGEIYSQQDLELLNILSSEVAVAIQNAQSYEEIRRFNITLQDEVNRATGELQTANTRLKELDKLKDEFVSVASHELRTPMTAIKSYTWMVLNNKVGTVDDKARNYLSKVYESTERLIHLVNEMLDISRIEGGRVTLNMGTTDLIAMVHEVQDEFKTRSEELKLTLDINQEGDIPFIQADGEKIHQVLENLVGNAFKFTAANGKVTMHLVRKGDLIQVDVTDTGRGIAPEDIDKLFTKFGRLEGSLVVNGNGTGLGLYICKQYIEMHKGKIWATSELGKGTTVSFTLPLT